MRYLPPMVLPKFVPMFLAVLLSACATDVTSPQLNTHGTYSWSEYLSKQKTLPAAPQTQDTWWRGFGDADLTNLIEQGMPANLDLAVARARVREARAQRQAVQSGFGPSVNLGGSVSGQSQTKNGIFPVGKIPGFDRQQIIYDAGFDAAWEIDVFGRNDRKAQIADLGIETTEEAERALKLSLSAEIARNYIDLRGAQMETQIMQGNIQRQETITDLIRTKRDYGEASDIDIERAQARLADLKVNLPMLETRSRSDIYRLSVLTGQLPDALTRKYRTPKTLPKAPSVNPIGLSSDILRRRPDIRNAERAYMIAANEQELTRLSLYPSFSLFGSAGPNTTDLTDLFDLGSLALNLGGLAKWKLYGGGKNKAQIEAGSARLDQAQYQYSSTVLSALESVETAAMRYTQSEREMRQRQDVLIHRQRIAKMAKIRFEAGTGTVLDVLGTEQELASAKTNIIRAQTQSQTHLISLYKALGGR